MRLFPDDGRWHRVSSRDPRARALADRHYSRQTVGADDFLANGQKLVLLTDDALAVWGVVRNLDLLGALRWRVTIFRNEGRSLSSELVAEGTERTFLWWARHYGGVPAEPLRTEVDASKVRRKRDPGRCFLRAGWRVVGESAKGLVVLEAPAASSRA